MLATALIYQLRSLLIHVQLLKKGQWLLMILGQNLSIEMFQGQSCSLTWSLEVLNLLLEPRGAVVLGLEPNLESRDIADIPGRSLLTMMIKLNLKARACH
ncbi:hypothetical protein TorRG33x02_063660 [Trema orientale]|uniref:Uncharacterized protein n=1 Tax=Trema orientale TaxID=63057 RepID=A0A2P5FJ32_TREOI|nr:hypothetical protein TorRG33x02_063660 [Trema orientale]